MMRTMLLAITTTVFAASCGLSISPPPSKGEVEALHVLTSHIHHEAFAVNGRPLDKGFAFIVTLEGADDEDRKNEPATYWVKGTEAYAVNELAHKISPDLLAAPSEVTHERVMKAVPHPLNMQ
jgi:hypothetical protein